MTTLEKARLSRVLVGFVLISVSVLVIIGAALIVLHYQDTSSLKPHSYSGMFLVGLLAAAPIPVFVPASLLAFVMGSVLDPLKLGLFAGAGAGLGNLFTCLAGRGGFHLVNYFYNPPAEPKEPGRLGRATERLRNSKLMSFARRRGLSALFISSLFPNPFLAPTVFGLGAAKASIWRVTLIAWTGQTAQAIALAYLGHYGLRSILDVFGFFNGS